MPKHVRLLLLSSVLVACNGEIGNPGDSPPLSIPGGGPGDTELPEAARVRARVVQLGPDQYDRTVRELLPEAPEAAATLRGLLSDNSTSALSAPQQLGPTVTMVLMSHAEEVGRIIGQNPDWVGPCVSDALGSDDAALRACLSSDFGALLERAWRRPATSEERMKPRVSSSRSKEYTWTR